MSGIAIYSGDTIIYWSGIVIALGVAACFALSHALYTSYAGNGGVLWVFFPLAVLFSVPLSRAIHWYCHAEQYVSFWRALTDYSGGGYCLPGVLIGALLAAFLVGKLGFTNNVPRMLDAVAPGGALCVAFIRLSAVFNSSCRAKIAVKTAALQHLPLASPIYISGAADYRFATFFIDFIAMLVLTLVMMRFYLKRRSAPMREGLSADGDTARIFLLLFSGIEFILDSTRYDSSFMHFNGFVSIVQICCAVCIVAVLVYYSVQSIRVNGRSGKHWAMWVWFFASFVCVGLSEYYVQRHGDWYLRCYLVMFIGLALLCACVYTMYMTRCEKPVEDD